MKYLREFLDTYFPLTCKTDRSPDRPLLQVLQVPREKILDMQSPENRAPEVPALGEREPCEGCGRTDWVVTVVMEYGDRLCPRCWTSGGAR